LGQACTATNPAVEKAWPLDQHVYTSWSQGVSSCMI
jgi:hypothetical protein